MGDRDGPACDTAAVAMTGPRPSEPPAIPPARGGAEARTLSGRLLAGDPTALADAYARFAGPLADASPAVGPATGRAASPRPAAALAAARAALARLWEHPLRFPASDDELAAALGVLTGRLAAEQPARGPTEPGAQGRARRQLRGGPGRRADGPEVDPRAELVAIALAARPAAAAAPPYAAPFAAWTAAVDRVLAELTVLDWDRPSSRDGRTPREVVARLAGLDAAVAAAIGIPIAGSLARSLPDTPAEGIVRAGARPAAVAEPALAVVDPRDTDVSDDGRAWPDGGARAGAGGGRRGAGGGRSAYWPVVFSPPVFWPPVLLWRTWHEGARGLCAWLAGREPETAVKPLDALGWTGSIQDHLTSRMLGTWLDGHAIAAAAGLRLPSLGPAELGAVTRLALGRARWATGPDALGQRHLPVTLALTHADPVGAGPAVAVAGRWLAGPGLEPVDLPRASTPLAQTAPAGTEVSLDVVDFCLLVTGRLPAAEATRDAIPCGAEPGAAGALLAGLAAVLPA